MATIMAIVTNITAMVRGRMGAVPLNEIMGQPTLKSVRHPAKQLATFASHCATIKWGGKHNFLPFVLSKTKARFTAMDKNFDRKLIAKPNLLNPKI